METETDREKVDISTSKFESISKYRKSKMLDSLTVPLELEYTLQQNGKTGLFSMALSGILTIFLRTRKYKGKRNEKAKRTL